MKKVATSVFLSVILIIATVGFVSSAEGDLSYEKQVNAEQTEKQLAEELRTYGGITKAEFEARREVMAKSGSILSDFHDRYTEDQYGGMWYDDEGYLNIYLLEESKALQTKGLNSKAKIDEQKALVSYENIKIHTAKYSLTELNIAKEDLNKIVKPNSDLLFYCRFGVNESLNRIEIHLPASFGEDTNEEVVALRKQIENMDTVVISYSEEADKKHEAGIPQVWSGPAVRDIEDPELAAKIMAEIEGSAMDVSVAPFEDNATYDRVPVDVTEIVDNSMKLSITPLAVNATYNVWLGMPAHSYFIYQGRLKMIEYSLGYAFKDSRGWVCWTTAGHNVQTLWEVNHWSSDAKMGTTNHTTGAYDGTHDLASITLENHGGNTWIPKGSGNFSGYAMTDGANVNNNNKWFVGGGNVCIEGRGGHTWGKIINKSETLYNDQINMWCGDRVTYTNQSWPGQSGGAVWVDLPDDGYKRSIIAINNGGGAWGAYGTNVKYVKTIYGNGALYSE